MKQKQGSHPHTTSSAKPIVFAVLCSAIVVTAVAGLLIRRTNAGSDANASFDNRSPARKTIELFLKQHDVAIFSKSYCGYSKRGKAVMRKHVGQRLGVMELDERQDGAELQDELLNMTGARTVPRIYVKGRFIGGANDVSELDSSGELVALLKRAGVVPG